MPHEGYADLVMNDRPGFHSDMPVNEPSRQVTLVQPLRLRKLWMG